jgi:SAM-dependent methyltransferase
MIEKESKWILPENLRKQEELERKAVDNGTFDGGGDFGSYYAYLKGVNYDLIKPHAVSDEQTAFEYANHINSILEKLDLKVEGNVIDIGCAIGIISNAINQLNKYGRTYGLDISKDSIEVAKKQHPNCIFSSQSADNLDNFDDGYFDVIHVKEFYPFTRTNDIQYHLKYLRLFHSKLKSHGFVILQMVSLDKGFCNTYKTLSKELSVIG